MNVNEYKINIIIWLINYICIDNHMSAFSSSSNSPSSSAVAS